MRACSARRDRDGEAPGAIHSINPPEDLAAGSGGPAVTALLRQSRRSRCSRAFLSRLEAIAKCRMLHNQHSLGPPGAWPAARSGKRGQSL
jgi:hypothetical protein